MRKIAIAGFGLMGQFHYRAYRASGRADIVAAHDADPGVFERGPVAGNVGEADLEGLEAVRKVGRFEDLLASDAEVIDVCVPTRWHRELAVQALEAGKHVLCEKPMALAVEDCDAMIEAAARAGRTLMIAQCVRFWPGYDILIEGVRTGRYGRPLSATFRRVGGAPTWSRWFLDASVSGGMVLDLLVHDFDFCRAAFGMPREIVAHGVLEANRPGSGVDYCQATLRYGDGPASVLVEGGWFTGPGYPFSMGFTVQFEGATWGFGAEPDHPVSIYTRDGETEHPEVAGGDGYGLEVRYFLDCLERGERPARCPPEESRDAIAIARAAERSIREGGRAVAL